jgi:hypothetical protein
MRCLKRHLAREFHRLLALPVDPAHNATVVPHRPATPRAVDTTTAATAPTPMICIT